VPPPTMTIGSVRNVPSVSFTNKKISVLPAASCVPIRAPVRAALGVRNISREKRTGEKIKNDRRRSYVVAFQLQKVNRVCNSRRRLLADSEKPKPPASDGWLVCPNSGEVMLPMMGPGFV
jgi:hypothetical protein